MGLQEVRTQALEAKGGGDLPEARVKPYAAPFRRQCRVLLRRKLRITFRNPGAIGMQLLMPIGMGVVLGAIFQGIGRQPFGMPQISFVFILSTMLSLQSLPLMPLLIEERAFMKHEASEKLYTEGAHILTIYAFSGLPYKLLPSILGWTLLLFFLFDALFQCVAAAAPDGQQAQTMATPFLVIFMLFNGSIVTRATAPVFLRWVFEVSPTNYAMEAIVIPMARGAKDGSLYVDQMGYEEGQSLRGIVVIVCMVVTLRVLQVAALKFLNNVQR